MKIATYGVLFLIFLFVIYQLNNLFKVDEELINKYAPGLVRNELKQKELQEEILKSSKDLVSNIGKSKIDIQNGLEKLDDQKKREEVALFTKRYFGQVGRNYRIYFLDEDVMIYLHRIWFDQITPHADVIKKDFPSIFEKKGCCFAAEPDFFIVIPGTNVYKEIGDYKFDR